MPDIRKPDSRLPPQEPRNWSEAFAALPLETPDRDAWPRLATEIRAHRPTTRPAARRHRRATWLALAAAVALAVAMPLAWWPRDAAAPATVAVQGTAATDETELAALYAQSARLESLLSQWRDERVATGPAAVLAGEYETRLAGIDAALSEPALSAPQRAALWRERIDALQRLTAFHGSQRLLAAQGERYDGQLVAVY
ncbi:MAG: hypothetical protein QM599_00590 [Pseudoxanthomonas sp.]